MSEWDDFRVLGVVRWAFYRLGLYRAFMRLSHRFNWHYAPMFGPIAPDGTYQRWCQWCGFRQTLPARTYPISASREDQTRHE